MSDERMTPEDRLVYQAKRVSEDLAQLRKLQQFKKHIDKPQEGKDYFNITVLRPVGDDIQSKQFEKLPFDRAFGAELMRLVNNEIARLERAIPDKLPVPSPKDIGPEEP